MSDTKPVIHMVGSIPLDDAATVFRTLGQRVGPHAERIPDGETGRRQRWRGSEGEDPEHHSGFRRHQQSDLWTIAAAAWSIGKKGLWAEAANVCGM